MDERNGPEGRGGLSGRGPDEGVAEPEDDGGEGYQSGTAGAAVPGTPPNPYQRAQARLRVDGLAYGRMLDRLREVSKKSGVPLTTVAKLLRGETEHPDPEVSCAMAYTFGFGNPGRLMGEPAAQPAGASPAPGTSAAGAGAGPLTLERLVEGLLRGLWAAQDAQAAAGAPTLLGQLERVMGGEPPAGVAVPAAAINLIVAAVVLNAPGTLG